MATLIHRLRHAILSMMLKTPNPLVSSSSGMARLERAMPSRTPKKDTKKG